MHARASAGKLISVAGARNLMCRLRFEDKTNFGTNRNFRGARIAQLRADLAFTELLRSRDSLSPVNARVLANERTLHPLTAVVSIAEWRKRYLNSESHRD